MEIQSLEIKGYRSLKDVSWKPGKLNVLIGPNGSGKSNLLRMLELISVSARGQLGRHVQGAGGMGPLVWDGVAETINFAINTDPIEASGGDDIGTLIYQMTLVRLGGSSSYRIHHESLRDYPKFKERELSTPFWLINRQASHATVFAEDRKTKVEVKEPVPEEESLLSLSSGPLTQNRYISPYQTFLANWTVYHDVRVDQDAPIRQSIVARHETRVEPDGQNLVSVLHTLYNSDRGFKEDINLAMQATFTGDFEELMFPAAGDQRIQLKVRWKSLKHDRSAADLSDGTLRFLFLVTVLASPDPPPLIAIDEPETGLHPSMFPIIAEYAATASKRTQVILTTHSPQFLDAFRDVTPTTTVVKCSDGETSLTNVEGESFQRWLKEFSLGSLFESGELEGTLADMAVRDAANPDQGGGE